MTLLENNPISIKIIIIIVIQSDIQITTSRKQFSYKAFFEQKIMPFIFG